MPSTTTPEAAPVSRATASLLYPTLLIAGIAVTIASALGIAAMMGWLPLAQSQSAQSPSMEPPAATAPVRKAGQGAAAKMPRRTVAASRCDDCGVVDLIHVVQVKGQGSGVGAVAGGVVGGILGNQVGGGRGRTAMTVVGVGAGAYAGHELEKNMDKRVNYEVHVRMEDNSMRVFNMPEPAVAVGQRVKIRNGHPVAAG